VRNLFDREPKRLVRAPIDHTRHPQRVIPIASVAIVTRATERHAWRQRAYPRVTPPQTRARTADFQRRLAFLRHVANIQRRLPESRLPRSKHRAYPTTDRSWGSDTSVRNNYELPLSRHLGPTVPQSPRPDVSVFIHSHGNRRQDVIRFTYTAANRMNGAWNPTHARSSA
jgi:hypothetical protein